MENDFYEQERLNEQLSGQSYTGMSLSKYTARVFGIMFLGLLASFAIGFWLTWTISGWRVLYYTFTYVPYFHLILLVAELIVVIAMTAAIHRISAGAATALFFVYAALTGVTFAVVFLAYDLASVVLAFGATSLYFGGMAVFGYLTRIDLSRIRNILLFGLVFLIIMNLLMLFIPWFETIDMVVCTVGVIIFLAYTAYDTQMIRRYYDAYAGDEVMLKKTAIISALNLYLDFVNLFLYVLRLFGKKRN